jgi:hypothetical protein
VKGNRCLPLRHAELVCAMHAIGSSILIFNGQSN